MRSTLLLMSVVSCKWLTLSCIWTHKFNLNSLNFVLVTLGNIRPKFIANGIKGQEVCTLLYHVFLEYMPSMLTCHIHLNIVLNAATNQVYSAVIDYLFLIRMRQSVHIAIQSI